MVPCTRWHKTASGQSVVEGRAHNALFCVCNAARQDLPGNNSAAAAQQRDCMFLLFNLRNDPVKCRTNGDGKRRWTADGKRILIVMTWRSDACHCPHRRSECNGPARNNYPAVFPLRQDRDRSCSPLRDLLDPDAHCLSRQDSKSRRLNVAVADDSAQGKTRQVKSRKAILQNREPRHHPAQSQTAASTVG